MGIVSTVQQRVSEALLKLYSISLPPGAIPVNETKPEFEGNYTVVLFSLVKSLRKNPEALGRELGECLVAESAGLVSGFELVKGFLNLTISDKHLLEWIDNQGNVPDPGQQPDNGKRVMVEYSSPNTNKPLHLGHLRNNFLGWSIAEILKANGYDTVKTCIANDRGIHICKSMVAWLRFANGATPQSSGIKGDHFVGDFYVRFGTEYQKETKDLVAKGLSREEAEREAPIMKEAQQMLIDWEAGKPDVIELWKMMNEWVYAGFDETYARIGSDFTKTYYESDTYLLGKELVKEGLDKRVFHKKDDGSVWIDLTADGLDEKIVQRKDGTAVYITQDIGLAERKQEEFHADRSIYVVGDEQNYHFKVLKLICQKLNLPSADGIYHLSYGMVELPGGRMKTREGTVVDADDIIDEMVAVARAKTEELGKVQDFLPGDLTELYEILGLGALKFFLLRVDPKKRILFNPEESIDFHGFTGPFIQYTYARTRSILRKAELQWDQLSGNLLMLEKKLLLELERYPAAVMQAGEEMNPSVIAGYLFRLAQTFNSFVTEHRVLNAESEEKRVLRLRLCELTTRVIRNGMGLLGIKVPERM